MLFPAHHSLHDLDHKSSFIARRNFDYVPRSAGAGKDVFLATFDVNHGTRGDSNKL